MGDPTVRIVVAKFLDGWLDTQQSYTIFLLTLSNACYIQSFVVRSFPSQRLFK